MTITNFIVHHFSTPFLSRDVLVFESSPTVTLPDGNLLVFPELSTGTAGREQGKQHWSLRPLVWGEWSLGSRHVSPDPTRTAGIDEEVFPAT